MPSLGPRAGSTTWGHELGPQVYELGPLTNLDSGSAPTWVHELDPRAPSTPLWKPGVHLPVLRRNIEDPFSQADLAKQIWKTFTLNVPQLFD